ncbi:MAG: ATP-binding protein [Bacteroidales bacterium]|nr:ATP-binding protein [Bacteroidales bacterium]
MKKRKWLPYGNSNFESIRTGNYVYIDKTRYIELLEDEDNKNLFFTRSRKFGKSLFFSMLSNYYDINQADKFEFHPNGKYKVYNPTMILYLFKNILDEEITKDLIDDNLKMDDGKLKRLIQNNRNAEQLIKIVEDDCILSKIIPKFSIDKLHDNEYFISLLFYLGLLTIDHAENDKTCLKIPNYSIRTVYWDYVSQLTIDKNKDVMVDISRQLDTIDRLAFKGEAKPYIDYVTENILCRLSNLYLGNFDEKYVKIILLNGLYQSNLYLVRNEVEVSNGYVDIYMQRSHYFPNIPYEWIWEVKYVKKEDADNKNSNIMEKKRNEARTQLEKYRKSFPFAGRTDVRYLSLIFIGKDKYEIE